MALESCGARLHHLARHMFAFGRPLPTAEMIARIDAVTVESARKAGEVLLSRSRPAFAAIGAGSGLERAIDNIDGLKVRLAAGVFRAKWVPVRVKNASRPKAGAGFDSGNSSGGTGLRR